MENLVTLQNLTVTYQTQPDTIVALDNVSLDIRKNELLAVVGESGCGKSTLALSVIGLLPQPVAKAVSGSIMYRGVDLLSLDQQQMREYRGTEIAMIFQEPLSSLNPVYRVGDQLAEAVTVRESRENRDPTTHTYTTNSSYKTNSRRHPRSPALRLHMSSAMRSEIIDALKLVRIPDPDQVIDRYPFELSGGMRQRVMIAMCLSQRPALLIADEPTTALDVTTQAQVLKLMKELMDEVKATVLLITHDLAVASQVADRVAVMYAGQVVEEADVYNLYSEPLHPYTQGLLACVPTGSKNRSEIKPIPGSIFDLRKRPIGCRFAPRCNYAMTVCAEREPALLEVKPNHKVACFLYGQ